MCAGAIYWAGIGRLVYGQSEKDLKAATGAHEENPTLDLPCRVVFAAGQRAVEIVGPLLEEEVGGVAARLLERTGSVGPGAPSSGRGAAHAGLRMALPDADWDASAQLAFDAFDQPLQASQRAVVHHLAGGQLGRAALIGQRADEDLLSCRR